MGLVWDQGTIQQSAESIGHCSRHVCVGPFENRVFGVPHLTVTRLVSGDSRVVRDRLVLMHTTIATASLSNWPYSAQKGIASG